MAISFYMGWDSLFFLRFFVCFSFDFEFFHLFDNFLDLFDNFLNLFDNFFNLFHLLFTRATLVFTLLSLIFAGFVKVLYKIRHIVVIVGIISSIISSISGWYVRSQFLQVRQRLSSQLVEDAG